MDELTMRISNWLNEKYGLPGTESDTDTEYLIENYIFSPRRQLLKTPDGEIQLTHKESVVLQILYTHRNKIIGRSAILQKVWDNETVYNSRTLDVYINRLRKYFGNDANRILTLKGIGYRFICKD